MHWGWTPADQQSAIPRKKLTNFPFNISSCLSSFLPAVRCQACMRLVLWKISSREMALNGKVVHLFYLHTTLNQCAVRETKALTWYTIHVSGWLYNKMFCGFWCESLVTVTCCKMIPIHNKVIKTEKSKIHIFIPI